jgi:hypothetical protein
MPIKFKCEVNGLRECASCKHEDLPATEEPCKTCTDEEYKCPGVHGLAHMTTCKRCKWEEKEEE